MTRLSSFFLILFLFSTYSSAGTIVYGNVTGTEGKPMLLANVFLNRPNDDRIVKSLTIRKDGKFSMKIDSSGIWIVRFTGVYHRQYVIAIYIDTQKSINLNVKLEPYNYGDDFKRAMVIGNFNNWHFPSAIPLKENQDGTFSASIKSNYDTVVYRLINTGVRGQAEGTQATSFAYNGKGGYNTLLIGKKGKVKIVFDPRKIVQSEQRVSFTFGLSDSIESRFARAYSILEDTRYQYTDSRTGPKRTEKFDFTVVIDSVKKLHDNEPNPLVRQVLQLSYFGLNMMSARPHDVDNLICRKVLDEIDPNSIVWSLEPLYISEAMKPQPFRRGRADYLHKVLDTNPIERTKVILLLNEIIRNNAMFRPNDEILPYLEILIDQYGDSPEALQERERPSSIIRLKEGVRAPAFSVLSLSDSNQYYTNDSFKGKYYLLDFWTTSNAASIDEIKFLQNAYDLYKGKDFVIVSISLDSSVKDVVNFQHGKWKMPWLNAIMDHGFNNQICKDYEVYSVPKLVLVDSHGNVVDSGWNLRGDSLKKVLKNILEKKD
jgi:peroxiredoxin